MKTTLLFLTLFSMMGLVSCKQSDNSSNQSKISSNASDDDDVVLKNSQLVGNAPNGPDLEALVDKALEEAILLPGVGVGGSGTSLSNAAGQNGAAAYRKLVALINATTCDADSLQLLEELDLIFGIRIQHYQDLIASGHGTSAEIKKAILKVGILKNLSEIVTKKIANC